MLTWDDGVYSSSYTYDELNRANQVTQNYPFGAKTIYYTYDKAGNKTNMTYPDNIAAVNYAYDSLNRLISVDSGPSGGGPED